MKRFRRRDAGRKSLHDFTRSLLLIVDPDALQSSISARITELFHPDRIIIFQLDPDMGRFAPTFSLGFNDNQLRTLRLRKQSRLARWLLTNETCLIVPESPGVYEYLSEAEREMLSRLKIGICVPLISLNRLTGIIMLGFQEVGWSMTQQDVALLRLLAGQAGLAFENANLYHQQRKRLRRIYRAERLAATGQLAAGVAHEIRNPLTAIRSTVQYALRGYDESDQRKPLLEELLNEVDRIDRTVDGLLSLTRHGEFVPEEFDPAEILKQSLLLVKAQAHQQHVALLAQEVRMGFQIMGDAGQLKQLFLNLLLNALQAMPEGGSIETRLEEWESEITTDPDRWAQIRIADTGIGIPSDKLDEIFDPFFTTKQEGTGLGLSVCHGIIQRHEGEIDIRSVQDGGTTVTVRFPLL